MKVLFCGGSPRSGSWAMRGEQIARAGGWKAHNNPTDEQIAECDIAVIVKKSPSELVDRIHAAKKTLVYDILDFWPQKEEQPKDLADGMLLAKKQISKIRPHAIIAANKCMANDLRGCADVVIAIYHHYRLDAHPARGGNVIYYDGFLGHLGKWGAALDYVARQHGYKFAVGQPKDDAAALFSARDNNLAIRWKSNVKAANAHGYAIPLITRPENGVLETHPYALLYDTTEDLEHCVLSIVDAPIDMVMRQKYSLQSVVKDYLEFFKCL